MTLTIDEYQSYEDCRHLEQEWDRFVADNGSDIFLTYGWGRIWWKYYGKNRKLILLIFRHEGNMIGVLPLFKEIIHIGIFPIQIIKIVGSDHTLAQFNLPLLTEHLDTITSFLFERLNNHGWDILLLGALAGNYSCQDELQSALNRPRIYSLVTQKGFVQTYFNVVEPEAYLAGLNKNERTDIRRNYRNLEKLSNGNENQINLEVAKIDNWADIFARFYHAHQNYWLNQGKLGHFGDWPQAENFHRELVKWGVDHDYLRLFRISYGDLDIGYEYNYKCGGIYYELLNSRNIDNDLQKISTGKIICFELIRAAFQDGVKLIDSMRGYYPHKMKLGGEVRDMVSLIVVKKGFAQCKYLLLRSWARMFNLLYYKIWFGRIAPRLPHRCRRPLNRHWIRTNMFS